MPALRHPGNCACQVMTRLSMTRACFVAILLIATVGSAAAEGLGGVSAADRALAMLDVLQRGLDRHPSIRLAGAAALIVPVLALAAAIGRFVIRRSRAMSTATPGSADEPVSHGIAWIEVVDRHEPPIAVGELVRIGKSDDCDLALETDGPAGMHAVIQRTPDREYILFDVSSGTPGLAVNGAPARRYRLSNGDRIEIGSTCVVFRTGLPRASIGEPLAA